MIQARALTRQFRSGDEIVQAVDGIDLDVAAGELVAVLGPNGAGKSTTMRMLTTLLAPTTGRATVAGWDVTTNPDAVRSRIGYVGQGNGAGHQQRVRDELVAQGRCYGLRRSDAQRRADDLIDTLELGQFASRSAGTLSGGQRRRVDIALGLVHSPQLLFLDEPSTGLDPQSRANLWQHILRVREQTGMTLLLTTHYLDEADLMAERVVIVDRGRVIADDTADTLKAELVGDQVTLLLSTEADLPAASQVARVTASADAIESDGLTVRLRAPQGARILPEILRSLDHAGVKLQSADVVRPSLDDVFLNLTGRSLREGRS